MGDERLREIRERLDGNGVESLTAYRSDVWFLLNRLATVTKTVFTLPEPVAEMDYGRKCAWCSEWALYEDVVHAPTCPWLGVLADRERTAGG